MQGDAIQLVGEEICKRIAAAQPTISVYFGPLDSNGIGEADLVLFPYRVNANADLRNREHEVMPEADDRDRPRIYSDALPLDVHYLLSPAPAKPTGEWQGPKTLGRAIQILNAAANIGIIVEGEIVHLSLDTTTTEEMGRIWAFFPAINFRTAVVYLATPVWIDPPLARAPAAPVVEERYLPRPKVEETA
jgi:hypothetical protein